MRLEATPNPTACMGGKMFNLKDSIKVGNWYVIPIKVDDKDGIVGIDCLRLKPFTNIYLPLGDGYNNPILQGRMGLIPKYLKKYLVSKGYLPKSI